ncbi:putative disease resistance protein RGA4 [Dioscorea cayenensis subsp. rotundata]|uniref:Disease resistance protein RGA4 n=1 Tax=Dioscorea cayennensis subsp. rotundata TaxID=55577 RepID=A0AB40AIB6_DIOCR|nr:putative disease resistance protein RGA4 [Dioscorea cayenensis subsp. rotundata]
MGSPLAAKTVGKLLECSLTKKHWKDVLENDLWTLKTNAHDIMPALALSYYHLPQHLQQCFVFCSLFPKNHVYYKDELICMWIANGFDFLKYNVNKETGFLVAQLRNMNELRTRLSIKDLRNIDNRKEAMKAKLKEKCHIKSLYLDWNIDSVDDDCKHDVEEVLEGLQPHPNLEELHIALGLLPSLEGLHFSDCENITIECESCDDSENEMFPSLQLPLLWNCTTLSFTGIPMFPSLQRLSLRNTKVSFTGIPTSSSSSSSPTTPGPRKVFPHLQELTMVQCNEMNGFPWAICVALKKLHIKNSSGMDDKLPGCLRGLSSLTLLNLTGAKIKTFDAEVMATLHALWRLDLSDCNKLLSLEGLQALPSLTVLWIYRCPKFRSWCTAEMAKLHELVILSCQDLESLPNWLHCLSSLEALTITRCPKLLSLAEGDRALIRGIFPVFNHSIKSEKKYGRTFS